jgi:hypothetical protein
MHQPVELGKDNAPRVMGVFPPLQIITANVSGADFFVRGEIHLLSRLSLPVMHVWLEKSV